MISTIHPLQTVNMHHTTPPHMLIILLRKVVFLLCGGRIVANIEHVGIGSIDRVQFKPSPFYMVLENVYPATQIPGSTYVW